MTTLFDSIVYLILGVIIGSSIWNMCSGVNLAFNILVIVFAVILIFIVRSMSKISKRIDDEINEHTSV
jgi:Na+-transporting methylmalonyl-CoA/oxaloacetate decarboxylase gamma subunit